ncbi:hypothetical protein EBZ38_11460 [bacterium]|nr:hypothetical protein [bacterium]NDC95099.1 hypothetical protein [bacterium]NDD84869.1 hypothetical protein [bacterium]
MSNFIVEVLEPQVYTIDIETNFVGNSNNIEVQKYDQFNIEIINTERILPSDLPDYPVNRIIGLNHYLDNYHFDCGTP